MSGVEKRDPVPRRSPATVMSVAAWRGVPGETSYCYSGVRYAA